VQASCLFSSALPLTFCTTGASVEGSPSRLSLPSWQSLRRCSSRSTFAQLFWLSRYSDPQSVASLGDSPDPMAFSLPLKIVSSLRTSESHRRMSFIILTWHTLFSAVADSLFVRPSRPMLETVALKFASDLPMLYAVEPQRPHHTGANIPPIRHNKYVLRSFPADLSPSPPALGYVGSFSGTFIDPRLVVGMSLLTNVVLMTLTCALFFFFSISWSIFLSGANMVAPPRRPYSTRVGFCAQIQHRNLNHVRSLGFMTSL
jgi:hypothetical protein